MSGPLPSGIFWEQQGNEEDLSEIHDCYCPNCHGGHGTTLLLPTKVPGFRELVIVTLTCPECNFRNSEVNFGGEIQPCGTRVNLTVTSLEDLNRQVLKSDSATLILPHLELEIPPTTQRGTLSTIEGMLSRTAENLSLLQPERLRLDDVENFHRCQRVIDGIKRIIKHVSDDESDDETEEDTEVGEEEEEEGTVFPFQFIVDDPAGNSYVENLHAPNKDPQLHEEQYKRTPTQDMFLGLQPSQSAIKDGTIQDDNPTHKNVANTTTNGHSIGTKDSILIGAIGRQEVMKFPTDCPQCYHPAETNMCITDIPHFKEVIIMSLACEKCGYTSREIKGGAAIPKYGLRVVVKVTTIEDLSREIMKSDSAGIQIPEIGLELQEGGLGGLYTTMEGLLVKLRERLTEANPFGSGDGATKQHRSNDGGAFSQPSPTHARYQALLDQLKEMADGRHFPFTLILLDPLANSFVGPVSKDAVALTRQATKDGNTDCYDKYVDPGMELEAYERTEEQNEGLGLNDMKVEGYGDSAVNYGTDLMEDVPDRVRRLDVRGPDHPHVVGKASVEGDTTVLGPGSTHFCLPSLGQQGKTKSREKVENQTSVSIGADIKECR